MTGFKPTAMSVDSLRLPVVVILGIDTPIGVAILRDLGYSGFRTVGIGSSKNSIGKASRHCHEYEVRASEEDALIDQLESIGERLSGGALMAVSESDNLLLNKFRSRLERFLIVVAPYQSMLEQVADKSRCINLASELGIRVPATFAPGSIQEVERIGEELTYPRVIKWADPNKVAQKLFRIGLPLKKYEYARDAADLVAKLRPYEAIGDYPLVQEYCPGQGIGRMFLVRNGEIQLQFQHERINEWPPEGGVSTLCKSVKLSKHEACRERSIQLLRRLQWNGVAMVEYRYDATTDTYYFMEINGRFWGSLPLAYFAGLRFASSLVLSFIKKAELMEQPDYPEMYCRFMVPEIRRLARLLFNPNAIQDPFYRYSRIKETALFLYNFIRPQTRYYLFSLTDPDPFIADLKNVLSKAVRGVI